MPARYPTLLDVTQSLDPNGQVATVAELLSQTNEIMADIPFVEGNLATGHRSVIRTGLPSGTWRKLYGGVLPDKSRRAQVTDSIGMLEAYAEIDKDLADLNGNTSEFRANEARAHLEGMSQDFAETLVYGDASATPERFTGLTARFNSLSASNADNIVTGGGVGSDNASIWLIAWDPNAVFGIYPKGSTAGLTMTDKGQVTLEAAPDGSGGRMEAYRTHFQMKGGLVVKDWRYVVRICNIDRSALTADISAGADLVNLMSDAVEKLPMVTPNTAFYMDRSIRQMWRKQMATKIKSSTLTSAEAGGVKSPTFDEIPVRRLDRLAVDEALVS